MILVFYKICGIVCLQCVDMVVQQEEHLASKIWVMSIEVLWWLSVWSKVKMIRMWSS